MNQHEQVNKLEGYVDLYRKKMKYIDQRLSQASIQNYLNR